MTHNTHRQTSHLTRHLNLKIDKIQDKQVTTTVITQTLSPRHQVHHHHIKTDQTQKNKINLSHKPTKNTTPLTTSQTPATITKSQSNSSLKIFQKLNQTCSHSAQKSKFRSQQSQSTTSSQLNHQNLIQHQSGHQTRLKTAKTV